MTRTLAECSCTFPEWLLRRFRAGIYARISSDRPGDGLGVARQIEDCERLAERKGWRVVEQYVDDDVSAWSGRKRPQYLRGFDRLHRQPSELESFKELYQPSDPLLLDRPRTFVRSAHAVL